jgi:hypothetical protein
MQEGRRRESTVSTGSLQESLLLHLFMESEIGVEVSKCERCNEWTTTVSRTFDHPLPSMLILANNDIRQPKFQWGDETIWIGTVDYHLTAVSFVQPGHHYVLTCRFLFPAFAEDEVEDNDAKEPWYFYDDTVRGGKIKPNPDYNLPPNTPKYNGYHVRSWYYVTRVPENHRFISEEKLMSIRSDLDHITNYEMIRQENVESRKSKKRKRNQDGESDNGSQQQDRDDEKHGIPRMNARAHSSSARKKKGAVNEQGTEDFYRRRVSRSGKDDRYDV